MAVNPLSGPAKTSGISQWNFSDLCLETSELIIITAFTKAPIEQPKSSGVRKMEVLFGSVSKPT